MAALILSFRPSFKKLREVTFHDYRHAHAKFSMQQVDLKTTREHFRAIGEHLN